MAVYNVKRIVLESYPVLTTCILIGLAAGYMLSANITKIAELPLVLAMIPIINGIGGNMGCILGARLASALHIGALEPRLSTRFVLWGNVVASVLISLAIFSLLCATFFVVALVSGLTFAHSLSLALAFLVAGIMLSAIVVPVIVTSAFVSFRGGFDPDNVVIPVMTSIVDFSGVVCLLIALALIGA